MCIPLCVRIGLTGIVSDVGLDSDDLAIVLFWLRKDSGPLQLSAVVITDS